MKKKTIKEQIDSLSRIQHLETRRVVVLAIGPSVHGRPFRRLPRSRLAAAVDLKVHTALNDQAGRSSWGGICGNKRLVATGQCQQTLGHDDYV